MALKEKTCSNYNFYSVDANEKLEDYRNELAAKMCMLSDKGNFTIRITPDIIFDDDYRCIITRAGVRETHDSLTRLWFSKYTLMCFRDTLLRAIAFERNDAYNALEKKWTTSPKCLVIEHELVYDVSSHTTSSTMKKHEEEKGIFDFGGYEYIIFPLFNDDGSRELYIGSHLMGGSRNAINKKAVFSKNAFIRETEFEEFFNMIDMALCIKADNLWAKSEY